MTVAMNKRNKSAFVLKTAADIKNMNYQNLNEFIMIIKKGEQDKQGFQ